MSMYIQSIESRAWQRVLDGWTPPMRDDDAPGPKPRSQWTADENTASIYNAKALNAMFTSVDMNMFNLIGTCTCTRNAWEKLKIHSEGSASVKKTRMRLITSKFEKMRMEESETIMEYNGRLKSLANEASVLGDPISNEKLVSKVLRSVPKRFHTKEVKESDLEENSIALISKKFTDYLKRSLKNLLLLGDLDKGMKVRECKGYGHYAYECANRLRKGMNVSLSDDDSEEEQEKVEQADLISFTALLNHEEQVADPYTLEGIQKLYEELLEILMSKKYLELGLLNSELEREKTTLDKFNSSSSKLDSILTMVFVKEGNDSLNHPSTASKGTRSIDNCYQVGEELACRHSKVYEFSLWHQKLGHVNFKTLKNLSKFEAVRGLPNLKSGVPYVCGACQKGFDPQDIRSEMGNKEPNVAAGVTTPEIPSTASSLSIIPVPMEPVPLAVLMPSEPGTPFISRIHRIFLS
ncbi:uncharacterized protein [Henckelia pumila]|uniref:uncharacterized protein n=1 Tax=Henckelia pumila TaxID=405737 RepID=UPI003C6E4146